MTYKAINFSDHARSRMKERGISRVEVRRLLATAPAVIEDHGRWTKSGTIRRAPAKVVYIETAYSILIVTVMRVEG